MGNKKSSPPKMADEDPRAENDVSKGFVHSFLIELKDVFWAEKHLAKLFQKMRKAAGANSLKDALAGYLDNIESQLGRLTQIFKILGETPREKKSDLMAALAEEAKEAIEHKKREGDMRDVRIVSTAQKIQNHKIASYSALIQLAGTMGNEAVISLLEEALSNEQQATGLLNSIIESDIGAARETAADETTPKESEEHAAAVYDSINLTGKHTIE
jgi:ferritin-like metal-binding protein YciE